MNGGNGYDEYDELEDWDAWVEEAFQDYQAATDPLYPPKSSSSNLPAKLPGTKKIHDWQLPLDWNHPQGDKAKKMREELEKLKQERIKARTEEAKTIKWKTIDKNYEYEVIVGSTSLGRVRQSVGTKWKMYPSFKWKDTYTIRDIVEDDYTSFHDSGHALVDLWVRS